MNNVYKLTGVVQHYSWGGTEFIPHLLHIKNENKKPFAEYWLGAHPKASSVIEPEKKKLNDFIAENPVEILGEKVALDFGSLPYLFKILDVCQMLSIQVHPSKKAAIEEYENENKKGIALTAANRNYKDQNHKPELMVALSDFWLLHGFKEAKALNEMFARVDALTFLNAAFQKGGYKTL
ncbi:MAG: mannose-6-phosphate isomerase, class I, partial [Bacteroidota bacterium]|nr:mannose-6-phosphate isomerase, class I [Bacteroidota bacterium]